ncbi:PH domain-containing protein [Vulcaniibacterium tengchongense]|uniref:Putative membrane protein n=1 Tax=Vulcaniibacterium tengchongense TaxID=1273429 RepID=A0A3N4VDF4_9GAMM|nr:PH domain-containing protein [Vulcaniibacterium tengchongense]RPE79823.1 putative membrane protein [Vulcaniibacterium tengchongense]
MSRPDPAAPAPRERRLHPMSWLFVLLQQLRQFIVPLLALLLFGRGDRNELWSLIGVGALALASLWQYFTYRYTVGEDGLAIRSGLLERSLRVIPFARIHNVALQQNLLHRLFGVAEVRLESAGGARPEAEMRVLKLADALALEALVRRHATAAAEGAAATPAAPLLRLDLGEVLRLGLVSNRGMIVVGAGVAALSQTNPELLPRLIGSFGRRLLGYLDVHRFGPLEYALGGAGLLLLAVALLRLFSVALALLQYHGFRLSEHGRRLTVERGLLARWRTSASRRRIQAWTLREGVLHRVLRRRSLEVDTAVVDRHGGDRGLRELAPIAPPHACDALIEHLLPQARWNALPWRPLPAASGWRLFLPALPVTALVAALAGWRFGAWGLLALAWLPWAAYQARRQAARLAYALNDALIAVREGWWSRHWRFAELDKLQALQLVRGPLDRRCGTATLWLDTAGRGAMAPPLRIRFLPLAEARALYAELSRTLARRPLRW